MRLYFQYGLNKGQRQQGPPKFSPESVIKDPNQTSLHFYRRSCHPFLRLSQTKYLYYTLFNTDELLINIWRGPGNISSYGRVVKGSQSGLFKAGRGRTQRLSLNPSILFYEIFIDITLVHKLEGDGLLDLLCPLLGIPYIVTSTSTNLPTTQVFSKIYKNSVACIVPPPRTS